MVCATLQDIGCIFKVCFRSEMCNIKQITHQAINFLIKNIPSLSEEDAVDLKLIYSELLINAVIHGNKMDMDKSIDLFIEATDNMVYSVISDEGSGFDYKKVLDGIKSNKNLLENTGRGIRLAYALSDFLLFNGQGNQVTFYKQIGSKQHSSLEA